MATWVSTPLLGGPVRVLGAAELEETSDGVVVHGAVHYLDGRELYGLPEWASMPMPDLMHPTTAGHQHLGERFAALVPGFLAQP